MWMNIIKCCQQPLLKNILGEILACSFCHDTSLIVCFYLINCNLLLCFVRVYPYLCQAVCNYVKDVADLRKEKECYVSFVEVPIRQKLRELNASKLGTLIRISGQVIRTHPVHPELVLGTFLCMDCNAVIKNVEQQFKV